MKKTFFLFAALLALTAPLFAEEIVGTKTAETEGTQTVQTAETNTAEAVEPKVAGITGTKGTKTKASRTAKKAKHSFKPKEGFVPNSAVAVQIAEAVLTPIYGAETIAKEKPLTAKLKKGIWTVAGTLSCPAGNRCVGGVVEADIAKGNGRILRVSHGK